MKVVGLKVRYGNWQSLLVYAFIWARQKRRPISSHVGFVVGDLFYSLTFSGFEIVDVANLDVSRITWCVEVPHSPIVLNAVLETHMRVSLEELLRFLRYEKCNVCTTVVMVIARETPLCITPDELHIYLQKL